MAARQPAIPILRAVARIWSLLSLAFLLLIFIGEALTGPWIWPRGSVWLGLALFPGGVSLGLVLGWWREGLGGAIAAVSLILFYLWNLAADGRLPAGPYFLLVAAPGLLFLACWALGRSGSRA